MEPDFSRQTSDVCAYHPERLAWVRCTRCDRPICGECVIPAPVGQRCPSCGRARVRVAPGRGGISATHVILGITVACYLLNLALAGRLTRLFLVQPYLVLVENQWWRLVTPVLAHGPIFHILFNMYALFVVGRIMESGQGTERFLVTYFGSAIAGSAASVAATVFLNPRGAIPVQTGMGLVVPGGSIGASGAVFGLFGALAFLLWKRRHQPPARAALTQIAVLILINLVIGFTIGGIDNSAHIGGMLGGLAIALGFDLADTRARWARWWCIGAVAVLVLSAALLIVARSRLLALL